MPRQGLTGLPFPALESLQLPVVAEFVVIHSIKWLHEFQQLIWYRGINALLIN
jgi:hypothetical protein